MIKSYNEREQNFQYFVLSGQSGGMEITMKKVGLYKTKVDLLMYGVNITIATLNCYCGTYKENNYGYNNPNQSDSKEFLSSLPTELLLDNEIIVSFRYNPSSSYCIKSDGKDLKLYHGDNVICKVHLSKRPSFWKCQCKSGIPMKRIGSVYGLSTLTFFLVNYCEYFKNNQQCKFCSIQSTYDKMKSVEFTKKVEDIVDVIKQTKAEDDNYSFLNFIGGSLYDSDSEFLSYINCIRKICDELRCEQLNGYVVSMPPYSKELLKELRFAGINGVKFNLEVSSEDLFAQICPGKSVYGYKNIESKLLEAVDIFGKIHVYTNMILGLEPLENIVLKVESLAKCGIGVALHIYHCDFNSSLKPIEMKDTDVVDVYYEIDKINKKYGIIPWLDKKSSRGCLSWDLYLGT